MPHARTRMLVVDQNLHSFEGHHHDYTRAVVDAAQALDLDAGVIAAADYPAEAIGGARLVGRIAPAPLARGGFRAAARALLARSPARLRRVLMRHAPGGAPDSGVDEARGSQILQAIEAAHLTAADHVLVHTLQTSEFLGLATVLGRAKAPAAQLHLVLRYDGVEAFRTAFDQLRHAPARLRFWTDTQELAAQMTALGCGQIGVLPIPHGLPADLPPRGARRRPLTLGVLGGARGDKGFHLLPDIVTALDERIAAGELRFLVQTNFGFSREESRMARSRDALRRPGVTLIEAPLDTQAFHQALAACDALLLPYDAKVYQRRSSGLLIQAMAAGLPVFVPAGAWLATEAAHGAGVVVDQGQSFAAAIEAALPDFDHLQTAAEAAAPLIRDRHAATRLVATLLGREG